MFAPLFHVGNLALGIGFLVPQGFDFSYLLLRGFVTFGLLLLLIWSTLSLCSGESFLFYLAFVLTNGFYLAILIRKHFPVLVPKHLEHIYNKMFCPLKVTKKEFRQLVRETSIVKIPSGHFFSVENETIIQPKLHLLMKGSLSVRSDGILLHKISPREFIDSVEWKAKQLDPLCYKYQVTVAAEEDCEVLVFDAYHLDRVYEIYPKFNLILDCLVGKDITRKLYCTSDLANSIINEKSHMAIKASTSGPNFGKGDHKNHRNTKSFKKIFGFHRTLSTDAIHTGCKGLVRSKDWMDEAAIKTICHETATDQVVVVNFDLDIPPSMECLPNMTPVHTMDKEVLAEAQFLAQQRKYWPSGFI